MIDILHMGLYLGVRLAVASARANFPEQFRALSPACGDRRSSDGFLEGQTPPDASIVMPKKLAQRPENHRLFLARCPCWIRRDTTWFCTLVNTELGPDWHVVRDLQCLTEREIVQTQKVIDPRPTHKLRC